MVIKSRVSIQVECLEVVVVVGVVSEKSSSPGGGRGLYKVGNNGEDNDGFHHLNHSVESFS